jgi:hypothetical protein
MTIDNPMAFPRPSTDHGSWGRPGQDGMTLRDYFAGQALDEVYRSVCAEWDDPALRMSKPPGETAASWIPTTVANVSYAIADAMLAARQEPTS